MIDWLIGVASLDTKQVSGRQDDDEKGEEHTYCCY